MKIDPSAIVPLTTTVNSEVTQAKKEVVATDSFVEAASDKAQLFSHADSQKLNGGSGTVSGLNVSSDQAYPIQIEKGTALNSAGKPINVAATDLIVNTPKRSSYFEGKRLEQKDLQLEQDYKMDSRRLAGTQSFSAEVSKSHPSGDDANQGTSAIDRGLLSSTKRIAAEFALLSPVIGRLCELTGKSATEIHALLNQYGLDPGSCLFPTIKRL